jgi:hypothetical protein
LRADTTAQRGTGHAPLLCSCVLAAPASAARRIGDLSPTLALCHVYSRIYSDGAVDANSKPSLFSSFVALTTLTLYTGWIHFLLILAIASWFSTTAFILLVGIFSTLLLPAKPVL